MPEENRSKPDWPLARAIFAYPHIAATCSFPLLLVIGIMQPGFLWFYLLLPLAAFLGSFIFCLVKYWGKPYLALYALFSLAGFGSGYLITYVLFLYIIFKDFD